MYINNTRIDHTRIKEISLITFIVKSNSKLKNKINKKKQYIIKTITYFD